MPPTHPLLAPLTGLLGTWTGDGHGQLPGGPGFTWHETFTVGHGGGPAMAFRQRTRRPDGSPFHAEDGWLRVLAGEDADATQGVELAVCSPTGVVEASAGTAEATADGVVVDCTATTVAGTPAAGRVLATRRRWALAGDELTVTFWMATPAHPDIFHHLTAELRRVADPDAATPTSRSSR